MAGFEWDETKASDNLAKHGVSFEEASTAFQDEWGLIDEDDWYGAEYRERLIGRAETGRLLTIIFTRRGDAVRLISARSASAHEQRKYDGDD